MVKKAILALACVLIASLAFAQTTTHRTRYYRTTTAVTSVEGVTVTAPIIASEGGSVASYQPAGTLVIRTDSTNPERFDLTGHARSCFLRGLGPSADDRSRDCRRVNEIALLCVVLSRGLIARWGGKMLREPRLFSTTKFRRRPSTRRRRS